MKTKIFKTILPAMMFFIAIGGAFAFSAEKSAPLGQEFGFLRGASPTDCTLSIKCKTEPGDICMTSNNVQVWKKNGALQCVVELHKIQ